MQKLKEYILKNQKKSYNKIFRDEKTLNNYPNYVGSNMVNNSKTTLKHAKQTDFYAFLKKELDIVVNKSEYFDSILFDMEKNNYLPRLNTTDNGVFPYQLNEIEMKQILEKQSRFYPFLLEKDNYGTTMEKIISILTFRIPYYVGPLNKNSKFSWIERKNEKIFPWNFDEIVDVEKSAQNFINRMKNHCTYLYDCTTLPKNSLIYTKYVLLNEINKININGYPITYLDKQNLINNLFLKQKKVTLHQIKTYFKTLYGDNVIITSSNEGKDIEEIKCNLAPWITFKNIFKDDFDAKFDVIESIIEELSIFEDKSILLNRLRDVYHLPADICKVIKGLSYKGFGKLSKDLLVKLKTTVVDELGEIHEKSIMDLLEETNQNFMEIIFNSSYSFKKQLEEYNMKADTINYEYIDSLPITPAVKRGIWSAIKIVNEVEDILKKPIDKFFIECTRGNGNQKQVLSRKKKLEDLYKIAEEVLKQYDNLSKDEFLELRESLKQYNDRNLRAKKLFLYFTQLGRCMYSNEPIHMDQLFTDYYDIDHIIPQSIVKDDSLDNIVLVKSSLNRSKKDIYPIPNAVLSKTSKEFWTILNQSNLISKNKFDKLVRQKELASDELVQFINRQLVFTNQTVKIVANLLKIRNNNCKVVWSKASNVSDFREKFDLPKCREMNDLHHAHDAYLNIVVGNVFNCKFGYEMNVKELERFKKEKISFKLDKVYDSIVFSKNKPVWEPNKTIIQVKKELSKVDVLTSYMMTENKGKFYKETIYSPGSKKSLIPLKGKGTLSDINKYGGYLNVEFAHFSIIKHLKKGKEQYLFVAIPILMAKKSIEEKLEYIAKEYDVINPSMMLDNIRKNMIILQNGFEYCIRGERDRIMNVQVYWDLEKIKYFKQVLKVSELDILDDATEYILHQSETKVIKVSKEENQKLYDYCIEKFSKKPFDKCTTLFNIVQKLNDKKDIFSSLTLKNQCIVLKNIMIIQTCKATRGDLSLIEEGKDVGRISLSQNLPSGTKIITKSVTGYYKKTILEI